MLEHVLFCVVCIALNLFAFKFLSRKSFGKIVLEKRNKIKKRGGAPGNQAAAQPFSPRPVFFPPNPRPSKPRPSRAAGAPPFSPSSLWLTFGPRTSASPTHLSFFFPAETRAGKLPPRNQPEPRDFLALFVDSNPYKGPKDSPAPVFPIHAK